MADSVAQAAFGTTITKAAGSAVVELTNISGPSMSADTIDVTSHDSDDEFREFISGIKSGGEISLEGNFVPSSATQTGIYTDLTDGSRDAWTIAYADAKTTVVVDGIVTGFEVTGAFDDKLSFSATLTCCGKPALTYTP